MRVTLLAHTPDPLRVLWTAARTCYSSYTPQDLWGNDYPGPEKATEFLRQLWLKGHHSVFEHVSLTYAVSGVSRVLLAQYSRHRIGVSLSVQSQRHVPVEKITAVHPNCSDTDKALVCQLYGWSWDVYALLVRKGVSREDARFVLPQGVTTNFVTTVNLRSLMHLYRLRVQEPGAQWEIKELVQTMVDKLILQVPELKPLVGEAEK